MKLETRIVNNVNVLTVDGGDFTFENFGEILDGMKKAVASASSAKFMMDISNVRRIDSIGLGSIVTIYKTVLSRQGTFGVIVRSGESKEIFFTTGLNKLFPIFDNESQAIYPYENSGVG
jgi:anti-anti-sigma factor